MTAQDPGTPAIAPSLRVAPTQSCAPSPRTPLLILSLSIGALACGERSTTAPGEQRENRRPAFEDPAGSVSRPRAPTPTGATSRPFTSTAGAASSPVSGETFDVDRERAIKATGRTESAPRTHAFQRERTPEIGDPIPRPRIATIDRAASERARPALPSPLASALLSRIPPATIDELRALHVPVLLPRVRELLETAKITVREHFYAASMTREGHNVFITGTDVVHEAPGVGEPTLDTYEVRRSELIASLMFRSEGAAYVLSVECASPRADPRCIEDAYIVGLADALALLADREPGR